jgi:hypothetical protein
MQAVNAFWGIFPTKLHSASLYFAAECQFLTKTIASNNCLLCFVLREAEDAKTFQDLHYRV